MPHDPTPDKEAADERSAWTASEIIALRNLLADEERRRVHLCEVMDAENTRIINEKIAAESEIAALRSRVAQLRGVLSISRNAINEHAEECGSCRKLLPKIDA